MKIKYSTESNLVPIETLKSGDVFTFNAIAFQFLDFDECNAVTTDDYICARQSDGYVQKFYDGDQVLPMAQSILEVRA